MPASTRSIQVAFGQLHCGKRREPTPATPLYYLAQGDFADAIMETMTFALPFASGITGEAHDVLNALWGQHRSRVEVTGDLTIADQWMTLIESAFSGR